MPVPCTLSGMKRRQSLAQQSAAEVHFAKSHLGEASGLQGESQISIYLQTIDESIFVNRMEEIWNSIADLLPRSPVRAGCGEQNDKLFLEAIFWLAQNGGRWEDLPARYGNSQVICRRFHRWAESGVWARIFDRLASSDASSYRFDGRYILHEACDPPHGLRLPRRRRSRISARLTTRP